MTVEILTYSWMLVNNEIRNGFVGLGNCKWMGDICLPSQVGRSVKFGKWISRIYSKALGTWHLVIRWAFVMGPIERVKYKL